WQKNHGYCWFQTDLDCLNQKPSIVKGDDHGNQGWYCFVVEKYRTQLEARKCSKVTLKYICEQGIACGKRHSEEAFPDSARQHSPLSSETALKESSSFKDSLITVTAQIPATTLDVTTKTVSDNLEKHQTSTVTPTTTTVIKNTVATATTKTTMKAAIKTTTSTTTAAITTSRTNDTGSLRTLIAVNAFLSRSLMTTGRFGITQTLAVTIPSLQQYFSEMRALNVTMKDSIRDAANITNELFNYIISNQSAKKGINILIATQELESFAVDYGKIHYQANGSAIISQKYFAMKIQRVSTNTKGVIGFSSSETNFSGGEDNANISIPSANFLGEDAVVVSILYDGIEQWFSDKGKLEKEGETLTNLRLGRRIISSTVNPAPSGILEENVTISFRYEKKLQDEHNPYCVFWDFNLKSKNNGSWSSVGCRLVKKSNRQVTCTCNHLTNFAVLMQVGENKASEKQISRDHKVALEVITYVGCTLSLVGESLTVVAYCLLMNLKQEQIQIRLNLVVAIAIAQITFLAGINATKPKGVCVFVAAMIHYFYTVAFGWMLFEGVYLYMMVVKVFNTVVRMRLFCIISWGLALLIVVLSIVIASTQDSGVHSYVHGDFCWISFTNNLIWTFAAPVLVVCLINSIILGRVVHEILRMQADRTSELERIRQGVKACVVLFPLLGMTWVFGVLSVTDAGLVFQYIFTIVNSLQGLFIFILHVLRNGDVRSAYLRKKQKWKELRSVGTSSTAQPQGSIDMLSTKAISETDAQQKKETRKPSSSKPRSLSSVGGSTFALHQERTMTPIDT
ncbi:unnamed protein product, partial [Porites lobata]